MKEIILHIGHGKTGSSFLQSCLALNREKLLDLGIDYPEDKSFEEAKKGFITSGNGLLFYENYSNIDSLSEQNKILFSSESFYPNLIDKNWFIEFAHYRKNKLKVILYGRNLFSHIFSGWGQKVKREGYTANINEYLINNCGIPFKPTLKWIELSQKIGFDLIIKNYSNHRKHLLNTFLNDLPVKKENISKFDLPKSKQVNRSLTFSEYEIQRILNNYFIERIDNFNSGKDASLSQIGNFNKIFQRLEIPILSNILINEFPDLKSNKLKCSQEAYDAIKNKNIDHIHSINSLINKNELIIIEPPEEVVLDKKNQDIEPLSEDQIKKISSYLRDAITVRPILINQIRDIALKIGENQSLDLSTALTLMKIAQELRPNGPFIKSTIEKWEAELNQKK